MAVYKGEMNSLEHSLITATIDALAHGGSCIGSVAEGPEASIGKKCLIPFVVPGEVVSAAIDQEEKSLIFASLVEIKKTSSDRVQPPCPVFGICGGCDFQHIGIAAQRREKVRMVERTLQRQGGVTAKNGVSLIGEDLPEWQFRRRAHFHVSPEGAMGFYRRGSGEVVETPYCAVLRPPVQKELSRLKALMPPLADIIASVEIEEVDEEMFIVCRLRESARLGKEALRTRLAPIFSQTANVQVLAGEKVLLGQSKHEHGRYPAGHFSQVNPDGNDLLVRTVCAKLQGAKVTELYAGGGNFTFALAALGKELTAVELESSLVEYGMNRAKEQSLERKASFVCSSCERYLDKNKLMPSVLLDPPRSGAKKVMEALDPRVTKEIIYVSCSLPTLTRDLKTLAQKGYLLQEVLIVDMFPQTHHVEMVAIVSAA